MQVDIVLRTLLKMRESFQTDLRKSHISLFTPSHKSWQGSNTNKLSMCFAATNERKDRG